MGIMDNMQDQTGDMDNLRARFEDLKSKETTGDLDDRGKQELQQMREYFDKNG